MDEKKYSLYLEQDSAIRSIDSELKIVDDERFFWTKDIINENLYYLKNSENKYISYDSERSENKIILSNKEEVSLFSLNNNYNRSITNLIFGISKHGENSDNLLIYK